MDQTLTIYNHLKVIRDNTVKLGPKTRNKAEIFREQLEKAEAQHSKLDVLIGEIKKTIGTENEVKQLDDIKICISKAKQVFNDIKTLCNSAECTEDLIKLEVKKESLPNMASFDIKVATGLLPIMTGSEAVTLQLIDGIEMYESLLPAKEHEILIKFVLKTRLTPNAKIRLNSSYSTVDLLIADMRTHLITRKSDTALSAKLSRARQGNRSVESFGKEIENLFVDLTISQANGDRTAYATLQTANERIAIKRFADGLEDTRIGTIIAAKGYNSLKDAIRCAVDEEKPRQFEINKMTRGHGSHNFRGFQRGNPTRNFRGRGNYSNFRGKYNSIQTNHSNLANNQNSANRGRSQNFNYRGKNYNYRAQNPRYMHSFEVHNNKNTNSGNLNSTNSNHHLESAFFRE
jgi:hypothetical protein